MSIFRPLGDRVVISPTAVEEKTRGGIIIPETAQEKQPRTGVITYLGPGRLLENGDTVSPPLRVGEKVLFDKYGATGFERSGEKFIVVDVSHVLGVFERE